MILIYFFKIISSKNKKKKTYLKWLFKKIKLKLISTKIIEKDLTGAGADTGGAGPLHPLPEISE